MPEPVYVQGVGLHPFGKHLDKSLQELGEDAIWNALNDAGLSPKDIQVAYVGNAMAGLITGQECVVGQLVLNHAGISGIPITNVENACASGSSAFIEAWMAVATGLYDVALAVGVEKLFCGDTQQSLKAVGSAADVDLYRKRGFQFASVYAFDTKKYIEKHGVSIERMAQVSVKNSANGVLNPYAQFRKARSLDEILKSRLIIDPLRLMMCSANSDGAAAVILCSDRVVRRLNGVGAKIKVAATALGSARFEAPWDKKAESVVARTARQAYERAGMGPEDIEVLEVHDAMAPAELWHLENLGFCSPGEAIELLEKGTTQINGRLPVNPSGGLIARGHPVGATGLAQIAELVWQMRGQAGGRQTSGRVQATPCTGLAVNTGGRAENDKAACAVHILERTG